MFHMEYTKIYTVMFSAILSLCIAFQCSVSFAKDNVQVKDKKPAENCKVIKETPKAKETPSALEVQQTNVTFAKPLQVVQNPEYFLNQDIKMNATFDKFSTLGLDYKKALRETKDYIGFLIQRDDVQDHNIPLSEMKLFLKRDYAESFIDLDTGDRIEITGKVFSNALGDPWIDVNKIVVLKKAKAEENTKDKK